MSRYAAFFGSINVGTNNRIPMADLRHAMAREEFENVETVVASGNVLFDFEARPSDGLEDMLAHMMADRFDIRSFVAVRTRDELAQAITGNPFAADGEENRVHTLFLSRDPDPAAFEKLAADHAARGPERLALGPRALYVDFCEGVAGSRLTNALIERRLECHATARNLRSLKRILAKLDEATT